MDLLKIDPGNACEMAFKIDEAMWKSGQEKSERKFLKLAERRKNPLSSRRKPQSTCVVTFGYSDAPFTCVQTTPGHPDDPPLKSFSNSYGKRSVFFRIAYTSIIFV